MSTLTSETWLILRNDFRLLWRDFRRGRLRMFSGITMIALVLVLVHVFSILLFTTLRRPPPLVGETIAWFFVGFLMLGAAMNHAVTVLFERADFDLLLSAPVSPRAILLARLAAMTAASALTIAIFFIPLLNGAAIGLGARYLWCYLVWLLVALIVTCAGVWLTLVLVRWLGPRRARTWAQVIAATLGAVIYIGFQMQNAVAPDVRGAAVMRMIQIFDHPALTFVAQAGRGEWLPLVAVFSVAGLAASTTTRLLGRVFVSGIQEASVVKTRTRPKRSYAFADGLVRATFRKDVRLIVRDPLLLSRVLPSVFYLVPVLFPLNRLGHVGAAGLLAPFAVLSAVMLSSQLAAVAASGEEGWDLIRLSPASTVTLRIAKIAAGLALPMVLCSAIAITVAVLGRPGLALLSLLTALISSLGSCWLEVAAMQPTPRKDLIQRRGRRTRTATPGRIIAAIVFLGIGTATTALAANDRWLFATIAFGIVALTAIGCFTLAEMQDIEFEHTTARVGSNDGAEV